ncbi:peptidylprolyl isomerase [Acaryochloris sp. CCMEE 5410]|uniref:peptidylprolyl isomerase n=1 Tax=Acaryochloris sp. CCMEE 5410 TaxID=310037 RepID=UPI0002483B0A|nr:peptidylprolyl isomerase [Acaryochloris sp. CCMEE 5410]KAI9129307.1 peptidylprolyl isomerase [Acaryochloris sp. CCMEE 5410]
MTVLIPKIWRKLTHRFAFLTVSAVLSWSLLSLGWLPSQLTFCWAALPTGDAVTNPRTLLRLALPTDNPAFETVQQSLEEMPPQLDDPSTQMRAKQWSEVENQVSKAVQTFKRAESDLLATAPAPYRSQASDRIEQINSGLADLKVLADQKNEAEFAAKRTQVWNTVDLLAASMIKQFPIEIPDDYQALPQLKGRSVVAMDTSKGPITIMVDGYSAPITAGNFLDLVQRGFYDNQTFTRADEAYVVQTGDPDGPDAGFVDPDTGDYRSIPLEVLVKGDSEPVYGFTLEELGLSVSEPVLPFSAYGTVAMGHPPGEPNQGSSQFFFHLFEPDLTPAGLNLLDGRYAVFGYVVSGQEVLEKLQQGDQLKGLEVVDISPSDALT